MEDKRVELQRAVATLGPRGRTRQALAALAGMVPKKTPLAALPALETSDPREILMTLARELSGSALVGG